MVTINDARNAALSLPEVEEKSHFERPDFRVKKKIFAVLHADKNVMMVKFSAIDQDVFCSYNKEIIFPFPVVGARQGHICEFEKNKKGRCLQMR